jgi:outer membrane protein assembly factor BamB
MRTRWIVVAVCTLVLSGCDWSMFMQDAAHTGTSRDTSLTATDVANGLTETWRSDLGTFPQDTISSSPVVANGVAYVGTSDGRLMAFDAAGNTNCSGSGPRTCQPLWSAQLGNQAITSTPAVANGVVYVGTQFGFLEGFDASGSTCGGAPKVCFPMWQSVQIGAIKSSPVVANGKVYIGSNDTDLYSFLVAGNGCSFNCPIASAYRTNGAVISSPAVANNLVYVGSQDQNLYAFDARGVQGCDIERQCQPLWVGPTGGTVQSSPSVAGGRVFVGSADSKLYTFDAAGQSGCGGMPKTCAPLWTATLPGGTSGSPAVQSGVVYVASQANAGLTIPARVNAFDAAGVTNCSGSPRTCQPLWVSNTVSVAGQTPISVVNGVVYVVLAVGIFQFFGEIFAFDEAAGSAHCSGTPKVCTPLWSAEPSDTGVLLSAVAVANGFVYAAGNQLHAFAKP